MQFIKSYEEFSKKESAFVLRVERLMNIEPKHFGDGKYLNFYIRIFIDIEKSTYSSNIYQLQDVSFVQYELHPSYRQPIRISEDFEHNFELKVWTYGFYPIKATVYLKLGPPITLLGNVEFPVTDKEKEQNKGEVNKN